MAINQPNKQETQEIDLLKLLKELWKHAWLIVLAAFLGGVAFFVYTLFFITPQYQSTALLYVNNSSLDIGSTKVNITSGDISASSSLIDTYVVILKSRTTLERAIDELAIPYAYDELVKKVSGGSEGNTPVFKITVTDASPEMAATICNGLVEIMVDKNSGISGIVEGSSVSVVDYAVVPRKASSPSYMKNTAIGMLLGVVLACGVVILRSLMDSTIRDEEFLLEKYKDIPLLSTIPDLMEDSKGGYYGYGSAYGRSSESARKSSATSSSKTDKSESEE